VTLLTATWTDSADDTAVTNAALDMFAKANAYASANGNLNKYIYLNYAYKTEKPISSYGIANVQNLKSISKKYDPAGIFQNQVPGGFKLATS
jgi:CO dehydrogenase/acetyl-CoA synthase gamma subunit (corrinoid Fe-S protein)